MKVSELITELQKQPPDAEAVILDSEWLTYDRVKGVRLMGKTELMSDPPTYFKTPTGKKPKHPDMEQVDAVEISVQEVVG